VQLDPKAHKVFKELKATKVTLELEYRYLVLTQLFQHCKQRTQQETLEMDI
jgi:hypothetical protein